MTTEPADLADCDLVVEAIAEDAEAKVELLARARRRGARRPTSRRRPRRFRSPSSAERSGSAGRFFGLHVFNPVARMELVELCLPASLARRVGERARAWCAALGKTAVEVPDQPGFVVNRLLFPYLFEAVRLMEATGMSADDVDACMQLGAGHPMGPLQLLDFVGLDVAAAIGDSLDRDGAGGGADVVPDLIRRDGRRGQARAQVAARGSSSTSERAAASGGRSARRRGWPPACARAAAPAARGGARRGPRRPRPRRRPGGGPRRRRSRHGSCASGSSSQRASSSASSAPRSAGPRCSSERSIALRTSSCLSVSLMTHMRLPLGRCQVDGDAMARRGRKRAARTPLASGRPPRETGASPAIVRCSAVTAWMRTATIRFSRTDSTRSS